MPAPTSKPSRPTKAKPRPKTRVKTSKPAPTQASNGGSSNGALSQREFVLVAATAGWTVFVVEVIVLLVMFAAPGAPRPNPVGPLGGGAGPDAGNGGATPRVPIQVTQIEITDNPYKASKVNVLGLPVTEPSIIVLDAVDKSEPYLEETKNALLAGLTLRGPANSIELHVLQGDEIVKFTNKPFTPGQAQHAELKKFLDTIKPIPGGKGMFWKIFEAGRDAAGKNFIYITPRSTGWSSVTSQLEKRLTPEKGAKKTMEVVQMGKEVDALKKFVVGKNGGRYETIDDKKFKEWQS